MSKKIKAFSVAKAGLHKPAALFALLLLSSGHAAESVRKDIELAFESPEVLTYGDVVITQQDVLTHLETMPSADRAAFVQDPELLGGALSTIYLSHAFLARVEESGLLDEPSINSRIYTSLARELRRLYREWYLDREELEDYSTSARELYLTQPDRFRRPSTVDMKHILLRAGDQKSETELMQSILDMHEEISAGASFEQLHDSLRIEEKRLSGDVSLTGIKTSDLLPQIAALLADIEPGELAPPIRTQFGWHLIKLTEIHEGDLRSWDDAKDDALRLARERHRTFTWERYLRDLQDKPYEFPEGSIAALLAVFGIDGSVEQENMRELETYLREQ